MVVYDYDRNAILSKPIKNRKAETMQYAFLKIHKVLKARGSKQILYIMENKCSSDLKEAMKNYEIGFQMAPPHMHRQNIAEWAIRTYKKQFLSGFLTIDPDFPISELERLLSQWAITLNLLQNSMLNPALSAYAYLFGPDDFNKSPMAPPGTRVIVHDKTGNRTSWGHHGTPGWYIGPSLNQCRCMQCYMPATSILRITYTLQYIPKAFFSQKQPQKIIYSRPLEI